MRKPFLFALPLVALAAAPAFAQGTAAEDEEFLAEIEQQEELDATVLAVDGLVGAILDMPVGEFVRALPETAMAREVRPGDTVRDMGSRDNPDFEEQVRGGARAMTAVLGSMAQRFTAMLPELEAMGRRIGEAAGE